MSVDFPSIDLSVLTARQREVIEMRYSCCLSFPAIAMFLGIRHQTVQEHHRLALERLHRWMTTTSTMEPATSHYKVDA